MSLSRGLGGSASTSVPSPNIQEFTSSGTWTKPAANSAIDKVVVEWVAPGGGGPAGSLNSASTGGVTSPGSYVKTEFPPETFNATESVVVGAGGSGGVYGGSGPTSGGANSFAGLSDGGTGDWNNVGNNTVFGGSYGAVSASFNASGVMAAATTAGIRYASGTGQTPAANGTNDSAGILSYVGAASGTTSATIPVHQVGDLIVAFAFRDGSVTPPTVPTGQGWNTIQSNGANTCSSISAWKIATTTSETTGTWTNADTLIVGVYRGSHQSAPIGQTSVLGGSGTAISFTGFDPNDADHPWVLCFAGHRTGSSSYNTPTGFAVSSRNATADATDTCVFYDTNGIVTAATTTALTFAGTASGWQSQLIEIKRPAAITPTNGANATAIGAGGGAGGSANRGDLQAGNGGNAGPGGVGGTGGSARVHGGVGTGLPGNGGNGGNGWVRVTTYYK